MNHFRWESLSEPLREFFRSLAGSPDGAVIEENGRPMFRVMAYPKPTATAADQGPAWTAADSRRRCELIDLDLDGRMSPKERLELEDLEARLDRHVDTIAPLPLEPLRQLHQKLLEKAAKANGTPGATVPFIYQPALHIRRHGPLGYAGPASIAPAPRRILVPLRTACVAKRWGKNSVSLPSIIFCR